MTTPICYDHDSGKVIGSIRMEGRIESSTQQHSQLSWLDAIS